MANFIRNTYRISSNIIKPPKSSEIISSSIEYIKSQINSLNYSNASSSIIGAIIYNRVSCLVNYLLDEKEKSEFLNTCINLIGQNSKLTNTISKISTMLENISKQSVLFNKTNFELPLSTPPEEILAEYEVLAEDIESHISKLYPKLKDSPLLIGITGGVGAGKTTLSQALSKYLTNKYKEFKVIIIPTDSFLYCNTDLKEKGIFDQKGFPHTFDWDKFKKFIDCIKSMQIFNEKLFEYSQLLKDIDVTKQLNFNFKDAKNTIIILEGINLLFKSTNQESQFIPADFLDTCVYLDIHPELMKERVIMRFLKAFVRAKNLNDEDKEVPEYFRPLLNFTNEEACNHAINLWNKINLPLYEKHIKPNARTASLEVKFI